MKVLQGQTLLDIAIQEHGSPEAAFSLAVLNGLDLTDDLVPGQDLKLTTVVSKNIAAYYANKGIKPATYLNGLVTGNEGIGYWAIGIDFIVS